MRLYLLLYLVAPGFFGHSFDAQQLPLTQLCFFPRISFTDFPVTIST
jgi:hypothetical protein